MLYPTLHSLLPPWLSFIFKKAPSIANLAMLPRYQKYRDTRSLAMADERSLTLAHTDSKYATAS